MFGDTEVESQMSPQADSFICIIPSKNFYAKWPNHELEDRKVQCDDLDEECKIYELVCMDCIKTDGLSMRYETWS